jgi:hypothetical protein
MDCFGAGRRQAGGTPAATLIIALVFLAQTLATLPVGLRLPTVAGMADALAAFPLCGGSPSQDRPDSDGQAGDSHDNCLLCQYGVCGGAILPGEYAAAMAPVFVIIAFSLRPAVLQGFARIPGYVSRGPPRSAA